MTFLLTRSSVRCSARSTPIRLANSPASMIPRKWNRPSRTGRRFQVRGVHTYVSRDRDSPRGKASVPYTPTSKHNFMHSKAMVCDDSVFTGSYNLSHSATMNAENALIIHDKQMADQYSLYIDQLIRQYRPAPG